MVGFVRMVPRICEECHKLTAHGATFCSPACQQAYGAAGKRLEHPERVVRMWYPPASPAKKSWPRCHGKAGCDHAHVYERGVYGWLCEVCWAATHKAMKLSKPLRPYY